jgi:hypothetical protein
VAVRPGEDAPSRAELEQAASGAADTVDVAVALRLVLMLENVECRPT